MVDVGMKVAVSLTAFSTTHPEAPDTEKLDPPPPFVIMVHSVPQTRF